jgi:hypothetical protein
MYIDQTFAAGTRYEFTEDMDYFYVLQAANADLTVEFYKNNAKISEVKNIGVGYAELFRNGISKVVISSTAGQQVRFATRLGAEIRNDTPPNGQVIISNTAGAFTQANATVTSTSGQLLAARATRRYLLIQNKDASGDIFVTLNGATATTAIGIKLTPGQALELQGFVPTGAINAIGSISSNANVVVIEG